MAATKATTRILRLLLIILQGSARRSVCRLLKASSALNQVNDEDNQGNYEQEMDQTAANVPNKAEKPEHDQDNNYSPKHGYSFRFNETFVVLFIQRLIYPPSFFGTSNRNSTVIDAHGLITRVTAV
jgi:hypothetical protein